jgi:hypothetical protein
MFTCAAASGTSDTDGKAGEDVLAFGGENLGEVAVTDAEVTVAESDEVAGTGVVASLFYCTVEHGIDYGGMGGEVNAVVHRALACERVGAVAER